MTIYIIFYFVNALIVLFSKNKNNIYAFFVCIIIYLFLLYFRWDPIPDIPYYLSYIHNFNEKILYVEYFDLDLILRKELGFNYLIYLIKSIYDEEYFVIWVISIIILLGFYAGSYIIYGEYVEEKQKEKLIEKGYINGILLLSLILAKFGTLYGMVIIKGGLSLSILCVSLAFILRKRYFYGLLLSFISVFFHEAAYIGLLSCVVIMLPVKISKYSHYVFFAILVIFQFTGLYRYVLLNNYIYIYDLSAFNGETIYTLYLTQLSSEHLLAWSIVYYLMCYFIFIFYLSDNNKVNANLLRLYSFGLGLFVIGQNMSSFSRFTDYFFVLMPVLSYITIQNQRKLLNKNVVYLFFVIIQFIFTIRVIAR